MKIKSILILSFAFVTFNIYSQDNLKKKENILIISELTNDFCTEIKEIFPTVYFDKRYFEFSQVWAETVISPEKNISCIIETPYRYETKFGKTEKIEIKEAEIKYFYNDDGFLNQIQQNNNIRGHSYRKIEVNFGKYGELIKKEISYETNSNGISKIIRYNEDGNLLTRYEIFYNDKGQILKYDSFDGNDKLKKMTKTFEYDNIGKLIKSSLFENYNNDLKIIPRRNINYSYSNNNLICKSASNNSAEGTNSLSDFSKIGGVTLKNYINNNKKTRITISDKSLQEIKSDITKRWENSVLYYEFIYSKNPKINSWDEKKIYTKLYNQVAKNELLYSIERTYLNSQQLGNQNNLTEAKEKIKILLEELYSGKSIENLENKNKFELLKVNLDKFYWWFENINSDGFPTNISLTREIVKNFKDNSRQLAKKNELVLENTSLNIDDLNRIYNEIYSAHLVNVNQTLLKIENRKNFLDLDAKNKTIDNVYILYPLSVYRSYKKENLYLAYVTLYNSIISKPRIDNDSANELLKIQQKMMDFESYNTSKLEKALKNITDEKLIAKAILDFQIQ